MASTLKVNTIAHSGGTNAITIDSSGRISTPARPSFKVGLNSSMTSLSSGHHKLTVTSNFYSGAGTKTSNVNVGGGFDNSTYRYTVQKTGIYNLMGNAMLYNTNTAIRYTELAIRVNGSVYDDMRWLGSHSDGNSYPDYSGIHGSNLAYLEANQYLEFYAYSTETFNIGANDTWFAGYLVG